MSSKRAWNEEEIKAALENRVPPGRSRRSLQRVRREIGAVPKGKSRRRWSKARIRRLKELHARGLGAETIAAEGLMRASANSIQKMMARLGLSKRVKIVKFSPPQRDALRRFLKANHEGRTPEELVEMWREAHPELPPVGHRRVVEYLSKMGLKMTCWDALRINNARRREAAIRESAQGRGASAKELDEALRRSRADVMRRRLERGRDIWSGRTLPPETYEEISA